MTNCELLNLIAFWSQDVYLTCGNNELFEKFRIYYKKHIIENIVNKIEIIGYEFIEYVKINNDSIDIKNMFKNTYTYINCANLNIKKLPRFKNLDNFNKLRYLNCSRNRLNNIKKLKYINPIKIDCSYYLIKKNSN